jgi:hypothetical protein
MGPGTIGSMLNVAEVDQGAWLALVITNRDRRGNERYDDDSASHYS